MNRKISVALLAGAILFAVHPYAAAAAGDVLKKIADTGVVKIGHREASIPFSYIDDKKQVVGYAIDLCLKVVDRIRAAVGKPLKVEFVPVTPQTRIALVANGTVDIECGSTTNTLTRQKQVAFSPVTFVTGTRLLVKANSGIKDVADLNGKVVAVAQGAANEKAFAQAAEAAGFKPRFIYVKDIAEGMLAVQTGRADALTSDDILLFGLITKSQTPADYRVVGPLLSYEPYGLMMRRDDPDFELLVRSAIADLSRSREIDAIYAKWFGPLGVPMSDQLKAARDLQALPQ